MAQDTEQGKILYSWDAPEYDRPERSLIWYVTAGIIIVLVVVYAIYTRQWSLAALTLVAAGVLYLLDSKPPKVFTHQIFDNGVAVGDKFYPYDKMQSFWLETEETNLVNLLQVGKFKFLLSLQLGDADVEKVRTTLAQFLPEETDREIGMADKISRLLKL